MKNDFKAVFYEYLIDEFCAPGSDFREYLVKHDDQIDKLDFETLVNDYVVNGLDELYSAEILDYFKESRSFLYQEVFDEYLKERQKK